MRIDDQHRTQCRALPRTHRLQRACLVVAAIGHHGYPTVRWTTHITARQPEASNTNTFTESVAHHAAEATPDNASAIPDNTEPAQHDDCVKYHLGKCKEVGFTTEQVNEAMGVATLVGGTIVIPHLRRAFEYWEALHHA